MVIHSALCSILTPQTPLHDQIARLIELSISVYRIAMGSSTNNIVLIWWQEGFPCHQTPLFLQSNLRSGGYQPSPEALLVKPRSLQRAARPGTPCKQAWACWCAVYDHNTAQPPISCYPLYIYTYSLIVSVISATSSVSSTLPSPPLSTSSAIGWPFPGHLR